jgi:hypothetical protein
MKFQKIAGECAGFMGCSVSGVSLLRVSRLAGKSHMLVLGTGATLIQDKKKYRHMQIQQLPHPLNYSKPGKPCIRLRKALKQSTLSALDRCGKLKARPNQSESLQTRKSMRSSKPWRLKDIACCTAARCHLEPASSRTSGN